MIFSGFLRFFPKFKILVRLTSDSQVTSAVSLPVSFSSVLVLWCHQDIKGLSRLLTINCFDRLQLSHNSEQDKATTEKNKRAKIKIIFMTTTLLVTLYYCEKLLKNILDHTNMLSLQNKTHCLIMRFSGTKGQTGSLISSNHPHICVIFASSFSFHTCWAFHECSKNAAITAEHGKHPNNSIISKNTGLSQLLW